MPGTKQKPRLARGFFRLQGRVPHPSEPEGRSSWHRREAASPLKELV